MGLISRVSSRTYRCIYVRLLTEMSMTSISCLPSEILNRILHKVPKSFHFECRQVCREWNAVLRDTAATKEFLENKRLGIIRMQIQAINGVHKLRIAELMFRSYFLKFKNLQCGKKFKLPELQTAIGCYILSATRNLNELHLGAT